MIMLLGKESLMEGILRRSNKDMFALTLLRSLAKLYFGSGMRVSF